MNSNSAASNNKRLSSILSRTRQVVELQLQLTQSNFVLDIASIQRQILAATRQVLCAQSSAVYLLDQSSDDWVSQWSLDVSETYSFQVVPLETIEFFKEPTNGVMQAPSMLCAPLVLNNSIRGIIQATSKKSDFCDDDVELMLLISRVAAAALGSFLQTQMLKTLHADTQASRWELANSRNTMRALFENLPAAIYIVDRQYRLVAINRNRADQLALASENPVGQNCYHALFQRSSPCPQCRITETFQNGSSTQRNERRRLGSENPSDWEISVFPIFDEEHQTIQAILVEQDVSEKRRLESILTQSEKLAAVGQLAAGVAHEINNPLTAIIANAQIIQRELPPDHDLQESVDLISRAGARAAQVIRNLLDFARREDFNPDLIDINVSVQRSIDLIQHELIARNIRLKFIPDPCLPAILASENQIQSVWLNLLLNAMDSTDKEQAEILLQTRCLENGVEVSVLDNGKGIPAERLSTIFEPFYTTKAPGRGTGLGLSLSQRIVKQHGGVIQVESQPGVGSRFSVILPIT